VTVFGAKATHSGRKVTVFPPKVTVLANLSQDTVTCVTSAALNPSAGMTRG